MRVRRATLGRGQRRRLVIEDLEQRLVLDGLGLPPAGPPAPLEQVIVTLKDSVDNPGAAAEKIMAAWSGELGYVYEHVLNGFSAALPAAAMNGLVHHPLVDAVSLDLAVQAAGQILPTGVDRINADLNYTADINGGGVGVDVDIAILDTGIDSDHLDLNVVGGRHFYHRGPRAREDSNYDDDNGHGSHVAGTAAALDNDFGVVGVAPGARLWAVKVLDSSGSGATSDVIAGMEWVLDQGDIEVVNMSLTGSYSSEVNQAVLALTDAGIVVVVAAGNDAVDADTVSPASADSAITVSAAVDTNGISGGFGGTTGAEKDDTLATFSNYGPAIDIAAPGVDIYSTFMAGGYATGSGTSMASPHVAGAAALYIAVNGAPINAPILERADGVTKVRDALVIGGQEMKDWRSVDNLDTESDTDGYAETMVNVGEWGSSPVAGDDSATTAVGAAVTIDVLVNDNDPDKDDLEVIGAKWLENWPKNGSVAISDNKIVYTPNPGFEGDDSFRYIVIDGNSGDASATVTVTVGGGVNSAPVALDDSQTTAEDTAVLIDVLANDSDADGDSLTVAAVVTPANGSVVINDNDTLPDTLTYTPNLDFNGTESFDYTVSDGKGGTDTGTVSITVTSVNDPPVAVDDSATTAEDTPVTFDVLGNDSDADGDLLTVTAVVTPANGSVANNGDGTLTYTPGAGFNGTESFDYTVADGKGGTDTGTVSITVTLANDPPVAVDDSVIAAEDTPATFDVLANDTDPDDDSLTVTGVTAPANGSVVNNGNGTLTYTPNPDFNGTDSFDYTVADGKGGTDTATVSITVTSVNDAPIFTKGANQTVSQDAGLQTVVEWATGISAGAVNESSQTLTFNVSNDNSTLFVVPPAVAAAGTLTYTPDAGVYGSATVTVALSDDGGTANSGVDTSPSQTFTITVNPPASEQTYSSTDTPLPIADPHPRQGPRPTVSKIDVLSGVESFTINVDITHNDEARLRVQLTSPSDTSDDLVYGAGEWSLSGGAFSDSVSGTWTLTVTDEYRDRVTGTLNGWSLTVTPAAASSGMAAQTLAAQTLAASTLTPVDTETSSVDPGELVSAGVIYGEAELDVQVRGRVARTAARQARVLARHAAAVDAAWTEGGIGGLDESLLEELATARV